MSKPKKYPWTARLANTKKSAMQCAAAAGYMKKSGAAEYDAWKCRRSADANVRVRRSRARRSDTKNITKTQVYMRKTDARVLAEKFTAEMDFRGEIRCGHFLRPLMGRTLTKLGIPVRKVLRGFDGSDRYGWKPRFALLVLMDEYADFVAYRIATAGLREKARTKRRKAREIEEQRRSDLACELGVLTSSRAFAWYLAGEIDEDECRRIGEITRYRHKYTNYDALLASGMSKDAARAIME